MAYFSLAFSLFKELCEDVGLLLKKLGETHTNTFVCFSASTINEMSGASSSTVAFDEFRG